MLGGGLVGSAMVTSHVGVDKAFRPSVPRSIVMARVIFTGVSFYFSTGNGPRGSGWHGQVLGRVFSQSGFEFLAKGS